MKLSSILFSTCVLVVATTVRADGVDGQNDDVVGYALRGSGSNFERDLGKKGKKLSRKNKRNNSGKVKNKTRGGKGNKVRGNAGGKANCPSAVGPNSPSTVLFRETGIKLKKFARKVDCCEEKTKSDRQFLKCIRTVLREAVNNGVINDQQHTTALDFFDPPTATETPTTIAPTSESPTSDAPTSEMPTTSAPATPASAPTSAPLLYFVGAGFCLDSEDRLYDRCFRRDYEGLMTEAECQDYVLSVPLALGYMYGSSPTYKATTCQILMPDGSANAQSCPSGFFGDEGRTAVWKSDPAIADANGLPLKTAPGSDKCYGKTTAVWVGHGHCQDKDGRRYDACTSASVTKSMTWETCREHALGAGLALGFTTEATQQGVQCHIIMPDGKATTQSCPAGFLPYDGDGDSHTFDGEGLPVPDPTAANGVLKCYNFPWRYRPVAPRQSPVALIGDGPCGDGDDEHYERCHSQGLQSEKECELAALRMPGSLGFHYNTVGKGCFVYFPDGWNAWQDALFAYGESFEKSCPTGSFSPWTYQKRDDWTAQDYPRTSKGSPSFIKCYSFAPDAPPPLSVGDERPPSSLFALAAAVGSFQWLEHPTQAQFDGDCNGFGTIYCMRK